MRFTRALSTATVLGASVVCAQLNILMTNDDGWASANIRAAKTALEASGHRVLIIGPLENQSGVGGAVNLPTSNVSSSGGIYGLATPGASYYAANETDDSIRYFNGTPAACALWGLNKALDFFPNNTVDLVISGPNDGTNLGTFVYSLSGTCGGAYAGAMFGVPSIAFSASNSTHRPYFNMTDSPDDPSKLAANLVVNLVDALAEGFNRSESANSTLLPIGTGLNVNFPYLNSSCTDPPYVVSRMTGGAYIDGFTLTEDGFPTWTNVVRPGLNDCHSGDCSLPGETQVVKTCQSSISVFSVDYDAPSELAAPVQQMLKTNLAPSANRRIRRRSLAARAEVGKPRRRAF